MLKQKLTGISRRDLLRLAKTYGINSTLLAAGSLAGVVTLPRLAQAANSTYEKRFGKEPKFRWKFGASGFNEQNMLIVFVVGMFLESLPVKIILAPILAPIADSIGMNPIHLAVIFLVGASIGFITPPYGLNLYEASGVTGIPYLKIAWSAVPYLVSLLVVWIVVALVTSLATILLFYEGANVAQ